MRRQEQNLETRLGWCDPVAVNSATGRILCCTLEADIARAVKVILTTKQGERVMQPTFGSNLHRFLFEVDSVSVRAQIVAETKRSLALWEPRITDIDAEVKFSQADLCGFLITLRYIIQDTGQSWEETYVIEG